MPGWRGHAEKLSMDTLRWWQRWESNKKKLEYKENNGYTLFFTQAKNERIEGQDRNDYLLINAPLIFAHYREKNQFI